MAVEFIHRFIPGALATAPTIVALHGTGGDEHELIPLARMIDGDSAILSIRGRIVEGGHPRFFKRISDGVFDEADLRLQTTALAEFLEGAAARYHVRRDRLVAVGYSNGANIAVNLLLTVPAALAGAVLLRPLLPAEVAEPVPLDGVPILISAGRRDSIVPVAGTEQVAAALTAAGGRVTIRWQDGGHALSPSELEEVAEWWKGAFGAGS